jgi:hypothetical protein
MREKRFILIIAVFVFLLTLVQGAEAASDEWEFTVAPYAWMAGIDGDIAIRGQKADVDVSFGDILDNVDFAFMLHTEARKGKWGFFFQPEYLKVSSDEKLGPRRNINVDVEIETWIVEFGGFYRAGLWGGNRSYLDLLLGGRYWNLSTEMDVSIPVIGIAVDRDSDIDIIDPFVGLRFRTYLTDKVLLSLRGDIGGFGISDSTSDVTWQAIGLFGYDISERSTIFAGYRGLGIDYDEDDIGLDLSFHGPIIGFAYRF